MAIIAQVADAVVQAAEGGNTAVALLSSGIGALVVAIGFLWRAYQGRQTKLDEIALKNVEVMTTFGNQLVAMKEAVERLQTGCASTWSDLKRNQP